MPIENGAILPPIARSAIAMELGLPHQAHANAAWLNEPGASFVTLRQKGQLRGCIGSLQALRPLMIDVKNNAVAAAFRDPRFKPVTRDEFEITDIEVSVLLATESMEFASEEDAVHQLRPLVDGVILEYRGQRGTFLPQVWEELADPAVFISHLKRKAGLNPGFWSDEIRLSRYTVNKWTENT
jgi:AmmeMemoRadiSam system protein A